MISRTSKTARAFWSLAYFLFLLAGIVAFFVPVQTLERQLIEILVYLWSGFLTAGSASCLFGKLRANWAGEIIGLPLLSAANYIFGLLLLIAGISPAAIAIGGMYCAVGTALVGRWIELRRLAKDNREVNSASD